MSKSNRELRTTSLPKSGDEFDQVASPSSLRRWEHLCWLVAIVLGLLQAWGRRHDSSDGLTYMGADGISYLDIGDAYMRGDWHAALNAMWSPFYSWLLGLTLHVFRPSPFWEFTVVRLLNFVIYLVALFSFVVFLRALRHDHVVDRGSLSAQLPDWSWLVFGYSIFIWSSLLMNRVSRTSPDILVSAVVFTASALLLQIRARPTRWRLFVGLGLFLGMGYLIKTVMFPLAFVFLLMALLLARRVIGFKHALPRVALSLLLFLAIALPFIVAISRTRSRFTIGESVRLNYAWYVNKTTPFIHWQGGPPGNGTPLHSTRQIFSSPAVYEFASPVGGTYAPWYDPSYWYEGVSPHLDVKQQLSALARNVAIIYSLLFHLFFLVPIVLVLFLLFYMSERKREIARDIAEYWFLILPSLAAVVLYLLVNIEPRYLAPFVPALVLGVFAGLRLDLTPATKRLLSGVCIAVVLFFCFSIAPLTLRSAYSTVLDLFPGQSAARDVQWQVADGLQKMGVRPDDSVASVGNTMFAAWPRLARLRVVAEIPETSAGDVEKFWSANAEVREQVLAAFAGTGARVVVADDAPSWATREGWRPLGSTNYLIYVFDNNSSQQQGLRPQARHQHRRINQCAVTSCVQQRITFRVLLNVEAVP